MKGSIRIITIAKIPVYLHWSFALSLLYVPYFGNSNGMSWQSTVLVGILFLALFACVLMHEFGHALVARRYGVETKDIILSPLGGIARLNRLPEKPFHEFLVAAAGPLVNLVIALVLSSYFLIYDFSELFTNVKGLNQLFSSWIYLTPMLIILNVFLLLFNLLPAFPMDGGRIFRSLLAIRLGKERATRYASWLAQVMAIGFFFFAFYHNDIILGLVGVFVFFMASYEYKVVKMDSMLAGHLVAEIMHGEFTKIHPSTEISLLIDLLKKGIEKNFLVLDTEDNKVVGVLKEEDLLKAIKDKKEMALVEKYQSINLGKLKKADTLQIAFRQMQEQGTNIFPVYEEDQLVGVVTMRMITNFLSIQEKVGR